ncbi:hypothetical protein [Mucilaginibacter sp. UYCu711]|uniref:hypothetical protein n=1 Tax=Mucilaginibacter sp. UYCu711 TaxID=3156339 RepID=UPI003D1CF6DB
MKKMFRFDLAWVILFLVVSTLITLNFMDEEGARNQFAGIVLAVCGVMFVGNMLLRSLTNRIG